MLIRQDPFGHKIMNAEIKKGLCRSLVTTEPRMEKLIAEYFSEPDFLEIQRRMIGDGLIGGKACGLLLAQKLVEVYLPEYEDYLAKLQIYFIGTGVFEEYVQSGKEFPDKYDKKLLKILQAYEAKPYVIRSSSRLEDGFHGAFTGKYASVFCSNQGTLEERLHEMKKAVCQVYESVFDEGAILYRKKKNLIQEEEKMGILIQEVAGSKIGDYYFPAVAGMGCSYNPYKWVEELDPSAGMIRLVMGLGTRAVQRTPGDYPRLVSLDKPQANMRLTIADRHKYSQRYMDVVDLQQKKVVTRKVTDFLEQLPDSYCKLALNRDTDAETFLRNQGVYRKVYFADCQGVVEKRELTDLFRKMEKLLEQIYEQPVDIEFAITCDKNGCKVNLLQCRPVHNVESESVRFDGISEEDMLFDIRRTSMGYSRQLRLDYIVWVDPQKYYECEYYKKRDVASAISNINRYFEGKNQKILLLVPGRIGTSSPELGVPVVNSDIYQFSAICEVGYSKVGYNPELSYGSHLFQDLIEMDIYYGAILENSKTRVYRPELLKEFPEILGAISNENEEIRQIVKVYDMRNQNARLLLNMRQARAVCVIK